MVIYFSGTGNSEWCARRIAGQIGDELLDAGGYIKNGIAAELISGRPWVFVAPTYAWQLPRVFQQFIRSGWFQGSREAYFVMTCGSDIGGAEIGIRELCREAGLKFRGILEVIMPENYIAMFPVPDEKGCKAIIRRAKRKVDAAIGCIERGESFPERKITAADRLKSGAVNKVFYPLFVKAKPFYAKDTCVGCGVCVQRCPMNNIRLEGGRPVWGDSCTHCMACISYCPVEAIEYGKRSIGKNRYRCEDYAVPDQEKQSEKADPIE